MRKYGIQLTSIFRATLEFSAYLQSISTKSMFILYDEIDTLSINVRGPKITKEVTYSLGSIWIKFYAILTTYPPQVDNCRHFTYYLPFDHVNKHEISTDHLPTLSCPRSY